MITIPFLRHLWNEHRLLLTADGATYLADVSAVEHMIRTDTYAPLMQNGRTAGNLYMSKSGQTIYADTDAGKYRFSYGFVVTAMIYPGKYAIGSACEPRGAEL